MRLIEFAESSLLPRPIRLACSDANQTQLDFVANLVRPLAIGRRNRQLLGRSIANDREHQRLTWTLAYDALKIAEALDGAAVDFGDAITGLEACLDRRTFGHELIDHRIDGVSPERPEGGDIDQAR